MKNSIKYLLKNIDKIQINYEKEYARSGMKFNLFSITKIERKEVDTHSAMIAELLNPKGSHHQGTKFLELFFNSIEYLKNIDLDLYSAKVKKEKSFNEGRVDIIVEFSNFILIIENKIDAIDQKLQIQRYYNIAKKLNKDFRIIYLTKYGSEATVESHNNKPYEIMSYQKDIIRWLEYSIKEMSLIPQIREILVQYMNLIKKITGVNLTMNESDEIIDDIKNNMLSAKAICDNYSKAQIEIIYDFFNKLYDFFDKDKEIDLVLKDELSKKAQKYFLLNDTNKVDKNIIAKWVEKKGTKGTWEVKPLLLKLNVDNNTMQCFCVMLATDWFHYGFINLVKDDKGKFNYVGDKDTYKNNQYEGFEFRNWSFSKWYSKAEELRTINDKVLEFILKPEEFILEIKEYIK